MQVSLLMGDSQESRAKLYKCGADKGIQVITGSLSSRATLPSCSDSWCCDSHRCCNFPDSWRTSATSLTAKSPAKCRSKPMILQAYKAILRLGVLASPTSGPFTDTLIPLGYWYIPKGNIDTLCWLLNVDPSLWHLKQGLTLYVAYVVTRNWKLLPEPPAQLSAYTWESLYQHTDKEGKPPPSKSLAYTSLYYSQHTTDHSI